MCSLEMTAAFPLVINNYDSFVKGKEESKVFKEAGIQEAMQCSAAGVVLTSVLSSKICWRFSDGSMDKAKESVLYIFVSLFCVN